MPNKMILVTGAAGFIGFHFIKRVLKEGYSVLGLDNINSYYSPKLKLDRLRQLGIHAESIGFLTPIVHENFTFVKGHLESDDTWHLLVKDFEVETVVNLAAQAGVRYSLENAQSYISSNIMGFMKVLEFCREKDIKELIYASSSSVYGMSSEQPFSENEACDKPVSIYAASKRSNELMAYTYHHLFGLNSIGLRFFTVYGPWGRPDMAPFIFTKAAEDGQQIRVFNNGEQQRDFTYVDDIVEGVHKILENKTKISGAEIANIGHGSPVELMKFIETIEKYTGKCLDKSFEPAQPGDVKITYADTARLMAKYNYSPTTSLDYGIKEFVKWYRSYYKEEVKQ